MIVIVDYGMGNLRSVQKAFEKVGMQARISHSPEEVMRAQKLVLPGVGAMPAAMERLSELHLVDVIKQAIADGKPFLGICLGLQLLFEKSFEGEGTPGLAVLRGQVKRFTQLKVPHMGWNQIIMNKKDCPLFKGVDQGSHVYFCHSYYVEAEDPAVILTRTEYGLEFTSSVWQKNIFGVQFHPEKSQKTGLQILKNFKDISL